VDDFSLCAGRDARLSDIVDGWQPEELSLQHTLISFAHVSLK